jgi:hypothetical protein
MIPPTEFGVRYPASGRLGLALPSFTFRIRAHEIAAVEVEVTCRDRRRVISYQLTDGVPVSYGSSATYPIGARLQSGSFVAVQRDLAADVRRVFGRTFVNVSRVHLRGEIDLDMMVLGPSTIEGSASASDVSAPLPAIGWRESGAGVISQGEIDPEIGSPTLETVAGEGGEPVVSYPRSGRLVAPYRLFSLLISGEQASFGLRVSVRTADGTRERRRTLRFSDGRGESWTSLRSRAVAGTSYRSVDLDLAAALAARWPSEALLGVERVQMLGQVRASELELSDPLR